MRMLFYDNQFLMEMTDVMLYWQQNRCMQITSSSIVSMMNTIRHFKTKKVHLNLETDVCLAQINVRR